MAIYESGEDYLEAVLMIEQQKGMVRSIDIANQLGFSKPSVSIAVRNLCASGHLEMDGDKHVRLTDKGRAIAEEIYDRHRTLEAILVSLGVPKEQVRSWNRNKTTIQRGEGDTIPSPRCISRFSGYSEHFFLLFLRYWNIIIKVRGI